MLALLLTPAVLSSLVLAAHFLRGGQVLLCAFFLATAGTPLVRRPWARRAWQGLLALGVLVWLGALAGIARERIFAGQSWTRPGIILGSVGAFTLLAAALLEHPRVRAHFVTPPEPVAPEGAPPQA